MEKTTICFFAGTFYGISINFLIQDWFGLDKYITHLRNNWTNVPWWIWAIQMILCSMIFIHNYSEENKIERRG